MSPFLTGGWWTRGDKGDKFLGMGGGGFCFDDGDKDAESK